MYDILEKNSKFKTEKLKTNTTLLKQGQLERFIRTLAKPGVFDESIYANKYLIE